MFRSGDDIMVEDVQISPAAKTVSPVEEDAYKEEGESHVKRPALNLQFGNITGIPSALGMTGVVGEEQTTFNNKTIDLREADISPSKLNSIHDEQYEDEYSPHDESIQQTMTESEKHRLEDPNSYLDKIEARENIKIQNINEPVNINVGASMVMVQEENVSKDDKKHLETIISEFAQVQRGSDNNLEGSSKEMSMKTPVNKIYKMPDEIYTQNRGDSRAGIMLHPTVDT